MKNKYEITYLVTPEKNEQAVTEVQSAVEKLIQEKQGIVEATLYFDKTEVDTEGIGLQKMPAKRKLAYPIRNQSFGYFLSTSFETSADVAKELNQEIQSNIEGILRYIIIKAPRSVKLKIQDQRKLVKTTIAPKEKENEVFEKKLQKEPVIEIPEIKKESETSPTATIDNKKGKREKKIEIDKNELDKKLDEILENQF